MCDRYNGWANYETWCVYLWLSNEPESYDYCVELAESAKRLAPESEQVRRKVWTVEEAAKFNLANTLKGMVEANNDLRPYMPEEQFMASMYTDLLGSALDNVNWGEIASAFLDR